MDSARERQLAEALADLMDGKARRDAATLTRFPELAGELDALAEIDRAVEPDAALPERLSGHKVLAEIGAGGMGRVLLAQDEALGRKVAIKTLAPRYAEDAVLRARFMNEARAMARLNHPHIVRIYHLGSAEEQPHFVMEYVEGAPLTAAARRGRERRAFHILHHEMRLFFRAAQMVDPHDVRMVEARHRPRLVHESGAQHGVFRVARRQRLDRHFASQRFILRQQHPPHAARPDFRQHLVPAQPFGQRRIRLDRAIDFRQGVQFPRQFRKPRQGGGVAPRLAVHQVGQCFRQLPFACAVHQAPLSRHNSRKRLSARYTNSATVSRDLPNRSAISAVERPSILASVSTWR